MIKLLFTTDTHGRANNPNSRKDNFPETILNKIDYVIKLAKSEGCDAIIHGGDWVNSPDTSPTFIRRLALILSSFEKPIYTVIGNHDEYGQNPITFEKTPLSILEATNIITRLSMNPTIINEANTKVSLTGVDAHYDLDKSGRISDYIDVPEEDAVRIHVVHGFLADHEWPNVPSTAIDSVLHTKADIVLTGHEHSGYGIVRKNGKIFCNPGALARVSASIGDVNQDVKVAIIVVEGNSFDIEYRRLPSSIARPANEVIDRNKLVSEKKHQERLNSFISDINKLKIGKSFNIYSVLDVLVKEEGVSPDLARKIREKLQEAEEQLKEES